KSNQNERTDAWICPNKKCGHVNAVGEQHCTKCGTRIGARCPKCGELVELLKRFCSKCGVDKGKYFEELKIKRIEELEKNQRDIQAEIEKYSNMLLNGNISKSSLERSGLSFEDTDEKQFLFLGIVSILLSSCLSSFFIINGSSLALLFILIGWGPGLWCIISHFTSTSKEVKTKLKNHIDGLNKSITEINKNIVNFESEKYGDEAGLINN
ncbi:MAG: zinc ribbon domain-containing protein, partial [Candidatus Methanofastidiosa archaeon]|nr:zinc ribbon domain-containing protein [Candidatus Methanofastidiosa archaeon]